jgi:rifampicin phosphotransferase
MAAARSTIAGVGRDKAAAVVTDGGILAAHASLAAREYGIPAVVGTGDATARLSPGQLVTVDGAAGPIS